MTGYSAKFQCSSCWREISVGDFSLDRILWLLLMLPPTIPLFFMLVEDRLNSKNGLIAFGCFGLLSGSVLFFTLHPVINKLRHPEVSTTSTAKDNPPEMGAPQEKNKQPADGERSAWPLRSLIVSDSNTQPSACGRCGRTLPQDAPVFKGARLCPYCNTAQ